MFLVDSGYVDTTTQNHSDSALMKRVHDDIIEALFNITGRGTRFMRAP